MTRLLLCAALLYGGVLSAQRLPPLSTSNQQARELAATITAEDLRQHLTVLSADDMEGRETGQPGQKRAAAYIAGQLDSLGLPTIGEENGYFQTIKFSRQKWQDIALSVNGEKMKHLREFYSAPSRNTDRETVTADEIIFLGYGIDDPAYSDYEDRDLRGKTILIFAGEPRGRRGNFRITGNKNPSDWSLNDGEKLRLAKARGVASVLIVDPAFKTNVQQVRKEVLDGRMRMAEQTEAEREEANQIYITPELARRILGEDYRKVVRARRRIERKGKLNPVTVAVDLELTQRKEVSELIGENVLGYVEGSDPDLKEEVLVVSAHYDHIGRRGDAIFNGADDNGSGSSTVLELAEAFVRAKEAGIGPRRSVLFLWVSGEEKGLLGSEYYASHPVFPLSATIADINVDMVGRVDAKHADDPYYIYVIGSDRLSSELHDIGEAVNDEFAQLELDYTYNAEDDPNGYYYRSDHYNFAERGIPSVFFFSGTHPDYHQDTDTIEKINFEKMVRIGRLIFHNAWQLSNQDKRIEVDVK